MLSRHWIILKCNNFECSLRIEECESMHIPTVILKSNCLLYLKKSNELYTLSDTVLKSFININNPIDTPAHLFQTMYWDVITIR